MDNGNLVYIFTDGACSNNPGPGGWGAVIKTNGETLELSGGDPHTTNNRMELTAAIEALKTLKEFTPAVITTDSAYVMNGLTQWLPRWRKNKWKTSSNKPVKNVDLWMLLNSLCRKHSIEWKWVKGHSGHPDNERCDELAREAIPWSDT